MEKGRTRKINSANLFLQVFLVKYFVVTKRRLLKTLSDYSKLKEQKFKTPTKPTGGSPLFKTQIAYVLRKCFKTAPSEKTTEV